MNYEHLRSFRGNEQSLPCIDPSGADNLPSGQRISQGACTLPEEGEEGSILVMWNERVAES